MYSVKPVVPLACLPVDDWEDVGVGVDNCVQTNFVVSLGRGSLASCGDIVPNPGPRGTVFRRSDMEKHNVYSCYKANSLSKDACGEREVTRST